MAIVRLRKERTMEYNYEESIKTLRTNLQFCGRNIRVIMFTSAFPNEGKSSISFDLAHSLAQLGKKTILVDADIRKSVLLSRYEVEDEVVGLSQYLSDQCRLQDVIYATDEEKLSVIFAGPYSPNPVELLDEDLCKKMFEVLKSNFDYVVVDTPPMANLIDGAILAKYCDGSVIVVESGAVSYRVEQKVKSQLEKAGSRILGVVLNKVDLHSSKYYGRYGRYGYGKYGYGRYGRYGGNGENKEDGGLN